MPFVASIEWAGKYTFLDTLNLIKAVLRNCHNKAGVFICFGAHSC